MRNDASWLTRVVKGTLVSPDQAAVARGNVCVDTRLLAPGDIFLALPGDHTDGALFIGDALRRRADAVIARSQKLGAIPERVIAIGVPDPHDALKRLACARRQELQGPVVAVTGSIGKTTTTEIIAGLLGPAFATHATRHSFNTLQGVAATVAGAPLQTRAIVVELAMQKRGEIAEKAALVKPTAGLVTNIAPVHLQSAGSIEGVARNKAELIEALPPGAPCVVPACEPLLDQYLRDNLRVVRHGPGGDVQLLRAGAQAVELECFGQRVRVRVLFTQPHNLRNLVAAVAVAAALGVEPPERLALELSPLRWQRRTMDEFELVLDCFNSSPAGLRAALESFSVEPARRRYAVLGEMAELGASSGRYHREAGLFAARMGIDALIAVGSAAGAYLEGYRGRSYSVETPEDARSLLHELCRPGDRVLVKGSRSAELERIAA